MAKLTSEGKCLYCDKTFKKVAMSRHLNVHLQKKIMDGQPGKSFHIKVEQNPKWGVGAYFLNLWVDSNATMLQIDDYLRKIWLECCGHMSAFKKPQLRGQGGRGMWDFFEAENLLMNGKTKEYEKLMEETNGEIPKSRKTKDALYKDLKLEYEYDFGSTTALLITVIGEYPIKADNKIVLLSRNEPLLIMCGSCGQKVATQMCTACMGEEEPTFCDDCAKKHAKTCPDFEDYAATNIVNSPRMGVCGYDGGTIDLERDRIITKYEI